MATIDRQQCRVNRRTTFLPSDNLKNAINQLRSFVGTDKNGEYTEFITGNDSNLLRVFYVQIVPD
ncbi:hypothetical protein, partial [Klebsiella pneumoniae]|uniref:hypothetical protein n=1 Tax=Klebsiella pneumoniae TaxID=573 RepID=UPI002930FC40